MCLCMCRHAERDPRVARAGGLHMRRPGHQGHLVRRLRRRRALYSLRPTLSVLRCRALTRTRSDIRFPCHARRAAIGHELLYAVAHTSALLCQLLVGGSLLSRSLSQSNIYVELVCARRASTSTRAAPPTASASSATWCALLVLVVYLKVHVNAECAT